MKPWTAKSVDALIDAVVRGELDEAQTLRLCLQFPELVTLALFAAGRRVGERDRRLSEQDDRRKMETPKKCETVLDPEQPIHGYRAVSINKYTVPRY